MSRIGEVLRQPQPDDDDVLERLMFVDREMARQAREEAKRAKRDERRDDSDYRL